MAANQPEGYADDFLEQILAIPSYSGLPVADVGTPSETTSFTSASAVSHLNSAAAGGLQQPLFPLGLSLDNGRDDVSDAGAYAVKHVSFFCFLNFCDWHFPIFTIFMKEN